MVITYVDNMTSWPERQVTDVLKVRYYRPGRFRAGCYPVSTKRSVDSGKEPPQRERSEQYGQSRCVGRSLDDGQRYSPWIARVRAGREPADIEAEGCVAPSRP